MRPIVIRTAAVLAAGAGIAATIAAGHSEITKAGLEKALPPTFANLYVRQAGILGIGGVTTATIGATTACDKGGPKVADTTPASSSKRQVRRPPPSRTITPRGVTTRVGRL